MKFGILSGENVWIITLGGDIPSCITFMSYQTKKIVYQGLLFGKALHLCRRND